MDARSAEPVSAGCWVGTWDTGGTRMRVCAGSASHRRVGRLRSLPGFRQTGEPEALRTDSISMRNIQTAKTRCADGGARRCAFRATTHHPGLSSPCHPRIPAGPVLRNLFSRPSPSHQTTNGPEASMRPGPSPVGLCEDRTDTRVDSTVRSRMSPLWCQNPFGPCPSVRGPSVQGHLRHGRAVGRPGLSAMR